MFFRNKYDPNKIIDNPVNAKTIFSIPSKLPLIKKVEMKNINTNITFDKEIYFWPNSNPTRAAILL